MEDNNNQENNNILKIKEYLKVHQKEDSLANLFPLKENYKNKNVNFYHLHQLNFFRMNYKCIPYIQIKDDKVTDESNFIYSPFVEYIQFSEFPSEFTNTPYSVSHSVMNAQFDKMKGKIVLKYNFKYEINRNKLVKELILKRKCITLIEKEAEEKTNLNFQSLNSVGDYTEKTNSGLLNTKYQNEKEIFNFLERNYNDYILNVINSLFKNSTKIYSFRIIHLNQEARNPNNCNNEQPHKRKINVLITEMYLDYSGETIEEVFVKESNLKKYLDLTNGSESNLISLLFKKLIGAQNFLECMRIAQNDITPTNILLNEVNQNNIKNLTLTIIDFDIGESI